MTNNGEKIILEKEIVALTEEPANGKTAQDIRLWLSCHTGEKDLANAMALVSNQAGWIADEVDDYKEGTTEYNTIIMIYERWRDLESELTDRIFSVSKSHPELNEQINWGENVGTHYQIKPFMELYGYIDKNGWWIDNTETE